MSHRPDKIDSRTSGPIQACCMPDVQHSLLVKMRLQLQTLNGCFGRVQGKLDHATSAMTKAWNTLRGREVMALGRELLGGNGVVSDFWSPSPSMTWRPSSRTRAPTKSTRLWPAAKPQASLRSRPQLADREPPQPPRQTWPWLVSLPTSRTTDVGQPAPASVCEARCQSLRHDGQARCTECGMRPFPVPASRS